MTRVLNSLTIAVCLASIVLKNPFLFLLGVLLALVAGVTALWDRYALAGVTYARRLGAQRLFVSEETDLWIEVVNPKPLPLAWLRIEDEIPDGIKIPQSKVYRSYKWTRFILSNLISMRFYERVRKHYRLRAMQRGALEFGPAELRSGDMFGFKYQDKVIPGTDWLIVYPKVVPVAALGLPAAYPFGDVKTRRKITPDPLRITGVRAYTPGDNPRFIHWKASARRGELQSKVFDPGATHASAIFLNARTTEEAGYIPAYFELAATAAASVARHLLDGREAVGLYANTHRLRSGGPVRLPPSRRPDRWFEILDTLAWINTLASASFERTLQAEAASLPFGAAVIAISAVTSDEMIAALLDLKRGGHPVTWLSIGESAPERVPDDLQMYWIGDHTTHQRLVELDLPLMAQPVLTTES
ncbi:MAG: DUF58 domain-containing protein [Thermoflexales bacterium]|nr:DUF58 domain-containing protein [Thermoflexales bacterium]